MQHKASLPLFCLYLFKQLTTFLYRRWIRFHLDGGTKTYIEQQAPVYYEKGIQDGEADVYNKPDVKQTRWVEEYEKGYNEAQKKLEEQYKQQGHQLAYTTLTYDDLGIESEKFASWHKEGFEGNTIKIWKS